jgi:filamentous hemagglutinin family protein
MGILLLAWGWSRTPLHANPAGGTVVQGAASFSASGSQFTVTTSDRAFINWQSFNIGVAETTTFMQPSSSSVVWNRINDPSPSQILGNLNANGYVILQNQSGFYVGGQASIATHGLIMTTAFTPALNLSSGGAWEFDAPPPTARIINYGRINIAGGGPAFLIASDIENGGTISDPGGRIGLYAGQKVLVSASPDGRGLSAQVTLQQGSVDNQGNLIADAGSIALHAQIVNQGGLIQANSVRNVDGAIELVASDTLNLDGHSVISAKGDSGGTSSGGTVTIKSDNSFSDQIGSAIDISGGAQGGNGGQVEISAPNMSAINSTINGSASSGFVNGELTIDPQNITLASSSSDPNAQYSGTVNYNDPPASGTLTLNVGSFASTLSQINLQALNNIELSTVWTLNDPGVAATLNLSAGNNITLDNGAAIIAKNNWSVNLTAGTQLPSGSLPTPGNAGIYLNGGSYIQTQNGNIALWAPNEVIVNGGAIRTLNGGGIDVTTLYGDVNTGTGSSGFNYISKAPYYTAFAVNPFGGIGTGSSLGGISTAAGGDVSIKAGGNVTSFDTSIVAVGDPGTGAFGSQPGNVTIEAGGSVFGHYVVVNGTGTITAGKDVGNATKNVALSLVKGSWSLSAGWDPIAEQVMSGIGDIYLQEVRNPNGVFNIQGGVTSAAYHLFDYDLQASVDLTAGHGVYLTGQNLPRPNGAVPLIMPPTLNISAGSGGVFLGAPTASDGSQQIVLSQYSVTLFPSLYGDLQIVTTDGGAFSAAASSGGILMSDSSQMHWFVPNSGTAPFSSTDHGSNPAELNNPDPVVININGSMNNVILQTSKETQISVEHDMIGCSFYGQNLHAGDTTSIDVKGQISNPGSFNAVGLGQGIKNLPLADLPPGAVNSWYLILEEAVNPQSTYMQIPLDIPPSQYASYVSKALLLSSFDPLSNFAYDPTTKSLTFVGSMSPAVRDALDRPLSVVRYGPDGNPLLDSNRHVVTDTITWVAPIIRKNPDGSTTTDNLIDDLYSLSQGTRPLGSTGGGFVLGGTGLFDIHAGSISLGNSYGIVSLGNGQLLGASYAYLAPYIQSGATINVTVDGDLNMPSSTIAALGGGDVNVTSIGGSMDLGSQYLVAFEAKVMRADNLGLGIYTSGGGNVTVTAEGTINIDSSRIATFNGGDVYIESYTGDVNAGSGSNVAIPVNVFSPKKILTTQPFEYVYANGIVADTLINPSKVPDSAHIPGNITVKTPQGDILASQGGILQEALNGNISAGPTINLNAGSPGFIGNITLGDSGVIGGTVVVTASGGVTGLVISRQNSTVNAAQNFSGTVLSGGTANLSAGGTVSGTVIGATGVNASGGAGVTASLLGQNVSVNGGAAQSTLGSSATATATSQSAAGQASTDTKEQVASSDDTAGKDDQAKKKKHPLLQRVKRVTVILPRAI